MTGKELNLEEYKFTDTFDEIDRLYSQNIMKIVSDKAPCELAKKLDSLHV